jgi:hypothetical protein
VIKGGDPGDCQLPAHSVETDIAGFERHSQHPAGTAQERFDSGNQLDYCERLCQVVVRPRIEPRNPVLDCVPRRQDQNGQAFSGLPRSR